MSFNGKRGHERERGKEQGRDREEESKEEYIAWEIGSITSQNRRV
jgi:hypothetical protein